MRNGQADPQSVVRAEALGLLIGRARGKALKREPFPRIRPSDAVIMSRKP